MITPPPTAHPFKQKRQSRHIIMLSIAAAVIVLAVSFFFLYLRSQKTGILILEPTPDLTVLLNGRAAVTEKNERGIYIPLYAGQYRIQLDKPGYLPFVQDIKANPGTLLELRPAFTLLPSVQETVGATIDFVRPSADKRSVYYLGQFRQRLFRLEVANQTTVPLTDQPLSGVSDVQWGINPNVALITQTDGTFLHEIPRFNFQNQIYTKIGGTEIISAVWDPNNSERIAAAYFTSSGEKSLVLANKQFTEITRVASLPAVPTPKLAWSPDSYYLLLIGRSADFAVQNLWTYRLDNGELKQVTTEGGLRDARFSPDSKRILFEKRDQTGKITRGLYNLEDGSTQAIDGDITLNKTAWKDASNFYEPGPDNQSLVLRNLNGTSERTSLSLPQGESIENMFYFEDPATVIMATRTAVYTVSLEKK